MTDRQTDKTLGLVELWLCRQIVMEQDGTVTLGKFKKLHALASLWNCMQATVCYKNIQEDECLREDFQDQPNKARMKKKTLYYKEFSKL